MGRRGYDVQDERWFSFQEREKLRQANRDITWLIDYGYKFDASITFVSNRFLFSNRQREALKRCICPTFQLKERKRKELPLNEMKGCCVHIDGFNLIITLEVALSGGTLVLGNDGHIRDLAGLRGSYRLIEQTEIALQFIATCLIQYEVSHVIFYLDTPVSNSQRLKAQILTIMKSFGLSVEVELLPNADVDLMQKEHVVSSDAVILDTCRSYFNVAYSIIHEWIETANIIDFTMEEVVTHDGLCDKLLCSNARTS